MVKPTELVTLQHLVQLGRRKSESTISTRWPFWAKTVARLKMVVDLPSPAPALTTVSVFSLSDPCGRTAFRAQHAISFGVRTFRAFLDERADILRNDAEHRRLQRAFHVVDGLHAGIEVFDEERQADANRQTKYNAQSDIQSLVRSNRTQARFSPVDDLDDAGLRKSQFNLFLGDAHVELFLDLKQILELTFRHEIGPARNHGITCFFRVLPLRSQIARAWLWKPLF